MMALLRAARRLAVVLLVAACIGVVTLACLGPPSRARLVRRNEIARFAPDAGGLLDLGGQCLLLVGTAFVGRRWLRVRL